MKAETILVCSGIEAMMHGVKWFLFSGNECTAVYTDNTEETAGIPKSLRDAQRAYYAYQNENGLAWPGLACEAPNTFSLVSSIQSKREVVI